MQKSNEQLAKEIHEEKKKAQIANIKEELDLYNHDLPALNTVYLILQRMRIRTAADKGKALA